MFIPLLCWTQQSCRSIFLMQNLYYAKSYRMRHNTKQGNPVHNSTAPGYATVNTCLNVLLSGSGTYMHARVSHAFIIAG
jgi:hypothetical protein